MALRNDTGNPITLTKDDTEHGRQGMFSRGGEFPEANGELIPAVEKAVPRYLSVPVTEEVPTRSCILNNDMGDITILEGTLNNDTGYITIREGSDEIVLDITFPLSKASITWAIKYIS